MITTLAELSPEARAVVEEYLAAVAPTIDADLREVVLCDLRAWLAEHLDADATPEQARAVVERAGGAVAADAADSTDGAPGRDKFSERIVRTMWAPQDPRLFLPRVVGLGWDLNFGALAVRLGLIEPDAEDVPFASVPDSAFRTALALPAAFGVATVAHYAVRGPSLPARLPNHFDGAGRPDRWVSKGVAATTDVALAVLPTAWAAWSVQTRRPVAGRVAALALAASTGGAAAALTVSRSEAADGRAHRWVGPLTLAGVLVPLGGTLLGLARAGRRAELRRDLGGAR